MLVQCLGCGDAFSSGGRLNSSFYIKTSHGGVLLDCGASVLVGLKRAGHSLQDIDTILISHLHGDHFGGLPFVLCETLVTGSRRKPLSIIGPKEIEERTRQALACFFPGIAMNSDSPVQFMTYSTESPLVHSSLKITAFKATHSRRTNPHMLRIEVDGKVVSYSGDTSWTDEIIPLSASADLFICEASAYHAKIKHHMSVSDLEENRHRISAKKTVITHAGSDVLKHAGKLPFPIAGDGEILYSS